MRLIDADKLEIFLAKYLHYGHAVPWVDAQPTAYDVDKVVRQLEKESYQELCDSERIVNLEDAIEIVEAGAING